MSKKMQKALLAFINEDVDQAKKLLRQVFIESAQKVNKELEESFDAEEEELSEDVDQDPEADLEGEVEYKLDEGWGDEPMQEAEESPVPEQEPVDEFGAEEPADDFPMGDESADEHAAEEVEGDEYKQYQVLIDELSEIFDKLQSGGESEVDMDQPEDGFAEEEPEAEGEFDDVPMGDSKFGESYKMKPVAAPEKSEKAGGNKKSPVAQVAKSPVDGVKPVQIKNGTVVTSDKEFKNSDTESVKVEDNNNVMDSAKGMMKDVKVPKHTAEKSRSPLPKK